MMPSESQMCPTIHGSFYHLMFLVFCSYFWTFSRQKFGFLNSCFKVRRRWHWRTSWRSWPRPAPRGHGARAGRALRRPGGAAAQGRADAEADRRNGNSGCTALGQFQLVDLFGSKLHGFWRFVGENFLWSWFMTFPTYGDQDFEVQDIAMSLIGADELEMDAALMDAGAKLAGCHLGSG